MANMESGYSILIIEDELSVGQCMATILEREGFDVRIAADGPTGLAFIRDKRPDLILCDILMPGMDGYEFHATVSRELQYADILFVFVSALCDPLQVRKGMLAGADDYLTKPFAAGELVQAVVSRLRRGKMLQQRSQPTFLVTEGHLTLLRQVTRRERQILLLVAQGVTSKEIADQLCISHRTVEVHRTRLMQKLGASNAVALSHWALIIEQLGYPKEIREAG